MRFCSYDDVRDGETLGVVIDGMVLPAADLVDLGPRTFAELIAEDCRSLDRLRAATDAKSDRAIRRPMESVAVRAPVGRPGKIICVGRNYRDHASESGGAPSAAPVLFAKFPTAVIGPGTEIRRDPTLTRQVDYEAELGVVIGRRARNISLGDAFDAILGYTCLNDVTARDLQTTDGQWTRAKSLDTFCPIGPVVVTTDEIPNPGDLAIRCLVNGQERQSARTSDLLFGVPELVEFCSRAFTLEPGDIIATGTPGGVGAYRVPPEWLRPGDEVVVEIERVGRLVNHVGWSVEL